MALRYLTIAPVPAGAHVEPTNLGRAAPWFPLIGLALGLVVAGAASVLHLVFPPVLDALLTVTVWKLLTGGLHLDGLSDCFDGLVGGDAADRLRIMHDSRIGAFGVIGLILFLLLEVGAVSELGASRVRALVALPALARAMPPLLAWGFPAARGLGQGAMFRAGLRPAGALAALVIGAAAAVGLLGVAGVVVLGLAIVATLVIGWFATRRLGGVTGDVMGATIEITELLALLALVAWTHAPR